MCLLLVFDVDAIGYDGNIDGEQVGPDVFSFKSTDYISHLKAYLI